MSEPMKWFLVWAMILFRNRKSFCFKSKPHPGGIFNFLRQGLIETIRKDQRKIIMDILASYASLEFIVFVIFSSHFPSHIYSYAFHFNGIQSIESGLLRVVFNIFCTAQSAPPEPCPAKIIRLLISAALYQIWHDCVTNEWFRTWSNKQHDGEL